MSAAACTPKTGLCHVCHRRRRASAFYKNASRASGLHSRCKDCDLAYQRERYRLRTAA